MSRTRRRAHDSHRREQEPPKLATATCPHPEKQVYRTKRRAKRSLRRMTGIADRETLRAYKCVPGCGLFHIGHKIGSRKNPLRVAA